MAVSGSEYKFENPLFFRVLLKKTSFFLEIDLSKDIVTVFFHKSKKELIIKPFRPWGSWPSENKKKSYF